MTDFAKGIIAVAFAAFVLSGIIIALVVTHYRDKELIENAEKQIEVQALREDYGSRDPYEFLETVPGARRAANGATDEFRRKRDEAIQRIRGGYAD
jgi:hypothetical protein